MSTSESVTVKDSFREFSWTIVTVLMWRPVTTSANNRGLQLSAFLEMVRLLTVTLPAEAPLPVPLVLIESVAPKDQARAANAPVRSPRCTSRTFG